MDKKPVMVSGQGIVLFLLFLFSNISVNWMEPLEYIALLRDRGYILTTIIFLF